MENVAETTQNLAETALHAADRVHSTAEAVSLGATGIQDVTKDAEHVALNLNLDFSSPSEAREEVADELRGLRTRAEDVAEQTLSEVRRVQFTRQEQLDAKESHINPDVTRKQLDLDANRAETKANQAEERKDAVIDSVQKVRVLLVIGIQSL